MRRMFRIQFIRYCVSGSVATAVDFGLFLALTRLAGVYYVAANIVSFLCAVVVNYALNRKWTFKSTSKRVMRQFFSFGLIALGGVAINTTLLYVFVSRFQIWDIAAKALATVIVLFWNYFLNRHITFKRV